MNLEKYDTTIKVVFFVLLSAVFIVSPYNYGLFFEEHMYIWEIIINILFILFSVYAVYTRQFTVTPALLFILPIMHLISFIGAESPFAAVQQILRWATYAAFFSTLYMLSRNKLVNRLLPYIFYIVIIWISILPYLVNWEMLEFKDAWLRYRMSSVFQYPNTFATVVVMGWLFGLIQLTKKYITWYHVVFYSFPLVIFTSDFLLSYSRGILVLFPIVWFIGLVLLKPVHQLRYIMLSGLSLVGGLYMFRYFSNNPEGTYVGLKEIFILTVGMIVLTWISTLINNKELKMNNSKILRWGIPTFVLALGVGFVIDLWKKGFLFNQLPEGLQSRIDSISLTTTSVATRFEFYDQAIRMAKDAPIFGFGGDGWRVLFTKYQEVPFWSREAHNFYLELVLNIGWIGTLIVTALIVYLFVRAAKHMIDMKQGEHRATLLATVPALVMLLLHALIDFDFSYGTTVFIFLWLLAMALPTTDKVYSANQNIGRVISIILIIGVGVGTFLSYQFYSAQELKADSTNQSLSHEEAEQVYLTAKSKNPWNTEYYIELAKVYLSVYNRNEKESIKNRAFELLTEAIRLEPHSPSVNYEVGKAYSSVNEHQKAIEQYEKAIEYDRLSRSYAFAYIVQNVLYSEQLLQEGQKERALSHLSQSTQRYEQHLDYIQYFKGKNVPNRRNLNLDKRSHMFVGEAYFLLGKNEKTLKVLNKVKYNPDKHQQEYIRSQAMKYIIAEEKDQSKKIDKILNQVKQKQLLEEQIEFLFYLAEKD